jgi:hypothetical protein
MVLVGRELVLARAEATLSAVENTRRAAAQPMVLIGPRGLGKTVTLAEIAASARTRGFAICSVTFDSVSDNVRLLAGTLAETAAPFVGKAGTATEGFLRRLESMSMELNAGIVKISVPASQQDETSARKALGDLLTKAAVLAADHHQAGIALFLDEVQEAPREQLVAVCNALQDTTQASIAVFAAGLPTTTERLMDAASFSERYDYQRLTWLSRPDAQRALLDPSLDLGVTWAVAAADAVLDEAGGSPYLIQQLGHEAWLLARPGGRGAVISETDVDAAIKNVRNNLSDGMFRGRWQKATPKEQELMAAIAYTADDTGLARTQDIANLLQATTPQLSQARKALIDKGLAESAGTGLLRFTMPGFGPYLRAELDLQHRFDPHSAAHLKGSPP